MDYTVEDLSPVKKKISITVSPAEVKAAIDAASALYRKNAQIAGFRKGKAPLSTIEKRFHEPIYKEAHDDLINVHINEALAQLNAKPLGGIVVSDDDKPIKKGEPYAYTLEFEVMPEFALPNYDGLEVEEEEIEPDQAAIDQMLTRLQRERSTLVPVEGNAPPRQGQTANLDFEAFVDDKSLDEFKTTNFDLELGSNGALPDFEEFVMTIPVGHTAEKVIHFPDDFIAPAMAGKDVRMKVTVHAVKERKLPELDDDFAKQSNHDNMEALREDLTQSYLRGLSRMTKSAAQKKLLDSLVRQTEFELPEGMVDAEDSFLVGDMISQAEARGKRIVRSPEDLKQLRQEMLPRARERAREKILLLAIAAKENLAVENSEVEREIFFGALKTGADFRQYFKQMRDTGMIFHLRDNMLCDKAMDLVYDRANIKKVKAEPDKAESDSGAGADQVETN